MGPTNRILAIWLACSGVAMAAPGVPHEHVVQPGQTLAKIAKRYRIDLDSLCATNDLKKSAKLQPGLRLTIPSDDDRSEAVSQEPAAATVREPRSNSSVKKPEFERRVGARATIYGQYLARPTRRGWVHILGHHGEWQGQLLAKNGKLQPKAVAAVSRLLAWPRSDFTMDRRLLTLLAQISDSFGGGPLRVVSGYRTTSYSSESKHPLGRACDFHVLGVPNGALREFARTFENVGVGYYPNSTFIHLDVRDHDAYWIDYAGPGEPPRSTPYRVARPSDEPPTNATRPATFVNSGDERGTSAANPEAAADMQLQQEEHQDKKAPATPSLDAAPPRRLGASTPQRDVTRTGAEAEPETAREQQPEAAAVQLSH
jgi:uncharacterized protein YcbK (DUF882 family)